MEETARTCILQAMVAALYRCVADAGSRHRRTIMSCWRTQSVRGSMLEIGYCPLEAEHECAGSHARRSPRGCSPGGTPSPRLGPSYGL